MKNFGFKFLVLSALTLSLPAWASYYSVLDNGEILAPGHYKMTGDGQFLTDHGGFNVGATFDMGFQDEYGLRALLGAGATDIFMGALFKWMPVPDIEKQPAIGFNVGLLYGKDHDVRDLTFRFEPIVSKKFKIDDVSLTPYASLPVGIRQRDATDAASTTYVAWQFVVGSQVQVPKWKNLQFISEVGVDIDSALSHFSVGAIFYFDSEKGFTLE